MTDVVNKLDLLEAARGVPLACRPLYWDRRLTVKANINTLQTYLHNHNKYLPPECFFDEVSVLVPGLGARESLVRDLMGDGWQVFNSATDLVFTNPFGTRYAVGYTFLRHPDFFWRIEVMEMDHKTRDGKYGFSPLHQALWYPEGTVPTWGEWAELPVPHLSFKVPNRRAFSGAVDHLREQGFIHAQTCQSTYGVFGYYVHQDAVRQIYVKPRVNVRDGEEE